MCARYLGDPRTDPVRLQHSCFEEHVFRQRRLEAAEEGEASLRAEIHMQERRKRRRADLAAEIGAPQATEAELERLQAEEEVSRPRRMKRPAPSADRVDSEAGTPDPYGFLFKGRLRAMPYDDLDSITREDLIYDTKAWSELQEPREFTTRRLDAVADVDDDDDEASPDRAPLDGDPDDDGGWPSASR